MRIVLLEIPAQKGKGCVNKDLAGGMGTRTLVGGSFLAHLFEYAKSRSVVLPNITIAYLAAIFKKAGWEPEIISTKNDEYKNLHDMDLILAPVSIVDHEHELEILRLLKKQNNRIGVYGTFAMACPDLFLGLADFVVKGEAEEAALQITKNNFCPKGIYDCGQVNDLDALPFPDWSFFPIKNYSYSPALNKKPFLTMLTSRGCPYSCSYYCPYTIQAGKRWRMRTVENIIKEIEYLIKEYQVKAIDFRDATFTLDRQRIVDFCAEIMKRKIKIIWSCETRLDRLDKELVKLMGEAGLRNMNVGIESLSPEVLSGSNRIADCQKHQEEILSFCEQQGVSIAAFYIFGLEEDTKETIRRSIDYAKNKNTLVAQFHISTPYPGTQFYEKIKSAGRLISEDWGDYNGYTPVFRHKNLTAQELLALKEKAFVSYYFRPRYLFKHIPGYIFQKYLWPF